mmetsp:Transcript_19254/g.45409  ORF Transcript_19254/g.45409 Transcript_19254/m.45409 type:complete len:143 (+) Transcript_19254:149-577(+)
MMMMTMIEPIMDSTMAVHNNNNNRHDKTTTNPKRVRFDLHRNVVWRIETMSSSTMNPDASNNKGALFYGPQDYQAFRAAVLQPPEWDPADAGYYRMVSRLHQSCFFEHSNTNDDHDEDDDNCPQQQQQQMPFVQQLPQSQQS